MQPRTGLLVGAAGADDHGRGRRGADRVDRRRHHLAGLAARARRALQAWGADVGAGVRFGETSIDGARVAITEYPCAKTMIGGEWRATTMRPCDTAVAAAADDRHQRPQRRAAPARPLPHRFRRQRRLPARSARSGSTTTRRPTRARARSGRRRGVAAGQRLRPRLEQSRPGSREPDLRAPTGGSRAPPATTAASSSPAGATSPSVADRSVPAAGAYLLHLWLRDEAGNDSPPTAVEVPLRLDDVPPGVAFAATTGGGFPDSVSADVYDEHSGPAGGELRYRRLGADSWTDLQARFVRGDAAGTARS